MRIIVERLENPTFIDNDGQPQILEPKGTRLTMQLAAAVIRGLRLALERQCNNMELVLNQVSAVDSHDRLRRELAADRAVAGDDSEAATHEVRLALEAWPKRQ